MKAVDPFDNVADKFSLFLENFAKMFAAMSSEEKSFLETLKNSEAALRAEMAQLKQLLAAGRLGCGWRCHRFW